MGTTTINGNIIKNKKSHEFKIVDSYSFKSASLFLCVLLDFDRLINIIDVYGPTFFEDSSIPLDLDRQTEVIKSNFKEIYRELESSARPEFKSSSRVRNLTIDLDKKLHILEGEPTSFEEIRKDLIVNCLDSGNSFLRAF